MHSLSSKQSVLTPLCSYHTVLRARTNAFIQWSLSYQKAACQHDLAVLPGAALVPGGTGQDARHHPLCTRLQGKVPRTGKQKHLPESPSCWLPEFTHREFKDSELPDRFQDMSLSLSLGRTPRAPEPKPKSQPIQNQMHIPPHYNGQVDKKIRGRSQAPLDPC